MSEQSFPKSHRLLTSDQFDRVFQRKCSAADGRLIVYAGPNDVQHPRLGLVVSRKIGKAVVRNRWKRLIREAFRLTRDELPPGVDLVVLPRREVEPELEELKTSLVELARRTAKKLKRREKTS